MVGLLTQSILSVNQLTIRIQLPTGIYPVVDKVSFQLFPKQCLALVGESGCGKTVTALSILRILQNPPFLYPEGEIIYNEQNLINLSEREMRSIRGARIAMIFQDPSSSLNPVYPIGDQLCEVLKLHMDMDEDTAIDRALLALEEVGIPNPLMRFNDYPHQLSGGMKQRVMIAMALLCEPDILIADEPTTALDVTVQAQILELIRSLQRKKGTALLLISHDMGIVAEMADTVTVMYASQAVEQGSVFQIFDSMAHPYTQGLFQSRPSENKQKGKLKAILGSVPPLTHYPTGCRFHPRCPYVMPKCKQGEVPNFVLEESPSHTNKCWLSDGSEESANKLMQEV